MAIVKEKYDSWEYILYSQEYNLYSVKYEDKLKVITLAYTQLKNTYRAKNDT